MVKSFLLAAIAVFCIIQVAQCRVAKKSVEPEVESTDISVSDIAKQAEDAILSVHSKFLEFWGVKNNDELSTLVQTQSKTYTEKLATLVKDIAEEGKKHSGTVENAANAVTAKITETIKDLESKNPELFKDGKAYQDAFEGHLRTVLEQTKEFGKTLKAQAPEIQSSFEKTAKKIYDTTIETTKTISSTVEKSVKESKA